jgi:hypothetical protein
VIIGICGAAGAGKDTIAERLAEAHGFRRIAFADPLYEMLEVMTGLPAAQMRDRTSKEQEIGWLGKSPRQLLQSLGTEWGRKHVSDDVWVRLTMRTASQSPLVAIPDVRFDNEAEAVREAGGQVWSVVRPGVSCLSATTSRHSSERGISPDLVDVVIVNGGDVQQLCGRVDEAIRMTTSRYNDGMPK